MNWPTTSTRRAHAAPIAVVLVVIAGCSGSSSTQSVPPAPPASASNEASSNESASATIGASTSAPDDTLDTGPGSTNDAPTVVGSESNALPNPGAVEAGTYALPAFDPPAAIELGDGWWAGWDYGDNISMRDGVVALEHRLTSGFVRLAFWDTTNLMINGSRQPDVRAYVREQPKVTQLVERATVIGGVEATRLDFAWTGGFAEIIRIPRAGFVLASDEPQHWIVLDTADGNSSSTGPSRTLPAQTSKPRPRRSLMPSSPHSASEDTGARASELTSSKSTGWSLDLHDCTSAS